MFEILSFYKISKLNKLKIIKKNILKETNKLDIKGLIILSPEGINGTISGSHKKIKLNQINQSVKGIILSGGPLNVYQINKYSFDKRMVRSRHIGRCKRSSCLAW